ncbi:MAG: hypothetical protein AAGG08_15715 [Actinomycetota bacterium]
MLSWSGDEAGADIDLTSIGSGEGLTDERTAELWRFASACGGDDPAELAAARHRLVAVSDTALMVDAAAVAANFEMMTRLADSTGATVPAEAQESMAAVIGAVGAGELVSRR